MRPALLAALAVLAAPASAFAAEPPCKLTEADWAALAHAEQPVCAGCVMTRARVARLGRQALKELCRTRRFFDDLTTMDATTFSDTHTTADLPGVRARFYATKAEREAYGRVFPLMADKELIGRPWKTYTDAEDGFAVNFPSRSMPTHSRRSAEPIKADFSLAGYNLMSASMLVSTMYLRDATDADAERSESLTLTGFTRSALEPPVRRAVTVGGLPATELIYSTHLGAAPSAIFHMRVRVVRRDHRVYTLMVMDRAKAGRFPEAGFQAFFDSFRFLPEPN